MKQKTVVSPAHIIYEKKRNKWHGTAVVVWEKGEVMRFGLIRLEKWEIAQDMRKMLKKQRRKILTETTV